MRARYVCAICGYQLPDFASRPSHGVKCSECVVAGRGVGVILKRLACTECGSNVDTPIARGRSTRRCSTCPKPRRQPSRICPVCEIRDVYYECETCSSECRRKLERSRRPPKPPKQPTITLDQRSLLRVAVEEGTGDQVREILIRDTRVDGECWVWTRKLTADGYGTVKVGRRTASVHRLMAEAIYGPLGRESVHHKCATRACIRPSHLQPISTRENLAEMLQRNYYLARITELEDALRAVSPGHSLLIALPDDALVA